MSCRQRLCSGSSTNHVQLADGHLIFFQHTHACAGKCLMAQEVHKHEAPIATLQVRNRRKSTGAL